jgi:hypothetical protein
VAQGFYFSRPLRAGEFDQLLSSHFAPAAELPGLRSQSSLSPSR